MRERNAELEAALVRSPDDLALRAVYADWLQARGDPWGELIALELAGKHEAAEVYRGRHRRDLLGDLPAHYFAWDRGFVAGITLNTVKPKILRSTLAAALELRTTPLTRRLSFNRTNDAELVPLIQRFPNLRALHASLDAAIVTLESPTMEELVVQGGFWGLKGLAELLSGRLPALRSLRVTTTLTRGAAEAILASPQLARLEVMSLHFDNDAAALVLQRWEELAHVPCLHVSCYALQAELESTFRDQLAAYRTRTDPR